MRKRVMSIALCLCMLVGLFAGLTVTASAATYIWPLNGYSTITSEFGYRNDPFTGEWTGHGGVDIGGAPYGTPVYASSSGQLYIGCTTCTHNSSGQCSCGGGYGNYVYIIDDNGMRVFYAHLTAVTVSEGYVEQGRKIGTVGSTGKSTGPHLHFEMRTGAAQSTRVNPLNYVSSSNTGNYHDTEPDPVTWELDSNGKLTIYDASAMNTHEWTQYPTYTNVKSAVISAGVSSISEQAFAGCSSMTSVSIPGSVTSIQNEAFTLCQFPTITLPYNLQNIGNSAFYACKALQSITIPNSVTSIGEGAFGACYELTSVSLPNNLKSISDGTFASCKALPSISIPNSVTSIGKEAFYNCTSLETVALPSGLKTIGKDAFRDCKALTNITIPDSVTSIGEAAFENCKSLKTIAIPNNITSIERYTFNKCEALQTVTIPASVTSIGNNAFAGCTALTSIYYGGTEAQWNSISIGSSNEALSSASVYFSDGGVSASGTCGDNLTWTLTGDGTLTIAGTGKMYDGYDYIPWYEYKKTSRR